MREVCRLTLVRWLQGRKRQQDLEDMLYHIDQKSNVVVVRKEDRAWTWRFKVRSSLEITKMTEIFHCWVQAWRVQQLNWVRSSVGYPLMTRERTCRRDTSVCLHEIASRRRSSAMRGQIDTWTKASRIKTNLTTFTTSWLFEIVTSFLQNLDQLMIVKSRAQGRYSFVTGVHWWKRRFENLGVVQLYINKG